MAHLRQVGLTELAELSVVSSGALALPGDAGPVVVAVRDLALVVPDAALGPLPARVAAAASLLVLSIVAAQHRTGALGAVWTRVARAALAGPEDTLPVSGAPPGTPSVQLSAEVSGELQALSSSGVIVEREEPVAGVEVVVDLPPHTGLARPALPPAGPQPRQHVPDVVDRETGHGVLASVET